MTVFVLAIAALMTAQEAPSVRDGRLEGVFTGEFVGPASDTPQRCFLAFRRDGTVIARPPQSSLEDFSAGRALTPEEAKTGATYRVNGTTLELGWAKGEARGSLELGRDGRVSALVAQPESAPGPVRYAPVLPWAGGKLTGHFEAGRITNLKAALGSHWQVLAWTLFEEGFFQHSRQSVLFSEVIRTDSYTTERLRGDGTREIWRHIQKTNVPVQSSSRDSDCGRFQVRRSGLEIEHHGGKKETRFLGVLEREGDTVLLVVDTWIYRGVLGKHSEERPGPRDVVVSGAAFEARAPEDWGSQETDLNGQKVTVMAPRKQVEHGEGVMLVFSTAVDPARKATEPKMVDELRKIVKQMPGLNLEDEKLEYDRIDGTVAARLLFQDHKRKKAGEPFELPVQLEAHMVVKEGTCAIAVAYWKRSAAVGLLPDHARTIARSIRVSKGAGAPAAAGVSTPAFDIVPPKGWTARELEKDGAKNLVVFPPGVEFDPEDGPDFGAFFYAVRDDSGRSATDKAYIAAVVKYLKQLAPEARQEGEAESLTIDGEPACRVRLIEKSDEGSSVYEALAVVKHGKSIWMVVAGEAALEKKHGADARKMFESLRAKK